MDKYKNNNDNNDDDDYFNSVIIDNNAYCAKNKIDLSKFLVS